ncbi:MAG: hypothetical protein AB1641_28230 [Thermodesulfobacteriota bacterium]
MRWKTGCLIVCGGLGLLIGLAMYLASTLTSGATNAAGVFLNMAGQGHHRGAYEALAPVYKARLTEAEFKKEIVRLGLNRYVAVEWSSRSVDGGRADLSGFFTTHKGERLPLSLTLVRLNGQWKVLSLGGKTRSEKDKRGPDLPPPRDTSPRPDPCPSQPW